MKKKQEHTVHKTATEIQTDIETASRLIARQTHRLKENADKLTREGVKGKKCNMRKKIETKLKVQMLQIICYNVNKKFKF